MLNGTRHMTTLSGKLSMQGVGRTLRRTIGYDTTVGSSRGAAKGIIHIELKNNFTMKEPPISVLFRVPMTQWKKIWDNVM
ncbi:hypothetical protein L195_g045968, partial [Trifolium pratense]